MSILITKKEFICLFTLFIAFSFSAQKESIELAESYEAEGNLIFAVEEYEKAVKQGANSADVYRKLAQFNLDLRRPEESHGWFEKLLESREYTTVDQLLFAEVLRQNEKYFEATIWASQYFMATADPDYEQFLVSEDYYERFKIDSAKIDVRNLKEINTESNEICPTIKDGFMYYSSSMDEFGGQTNIDIATNSNFLNVYKSEVDGIKPSKKYVEVNGINGKFHESNLAFDGEDEVYFTRNHKKLYKDGREDELLRTLKIVRAKKTGNGWNVTDDFPHNNEAYSVGHPTVSKDGQMLVFISDMPGGIGGTDLYMCLKDETGQWSAPQNLGDKVNSKGNEKFPYLHTDNSLYYSSDGMHGLGGLDIHVCPLLKGEFLEPQNLGYPINSSRDDFGFFYDSKNNRGFFSSNRTGGKGEDDIYAYVLNDTLNFLVKGRVLDVDTKKRTKKLKAKLMDLDDNVIEEIEMSDDGSFMFNNEEFRNKGFKVVIEDEEGVYGTFTSRSLKGNGLNSGLDMGLIYVKKLPLILSGVLMDHKNDKTLRGVKVTVINRETGEVFEEFITASNGEFTFEGLEEFTKYTIKLEREGFFTRTVDFETGINRHINFNDLDWGYMESIEPEIPIVLDEYSEINFDLGSWKIRPDAEPALDYLTILLMENPYIAIELSAHTDCLGQDDFNLELSHKRARSAYEYLVISGGINHEQVITKGYGETKPIVDCGKSCSRCNSKQLAENRRIEFKVISTDFSQIPDEYKIEREVIPVEELMNEGNQK
ncbi:MAG: OmpA family protein [Bacteroidota bacterium]